MVIPTAHVGGLRTPPVLGGILFLEESYIGAIPVLGEVLWDEFSLGGVPWEESCGKSPV